MKYEWKKNEKELYGAKAAPALVNVPKQSYIMIGGKGNPNDELFSEKVSALYSLAYGIKMSYKSMAGSGETGNGILDFSVYPLEGIWTGGLVDSNLVKEKLEYTIMIKQPDFITREMFGSALEKVKKKKPSPLYADITFDTMEDGMCVQLLHTGPYDDEPESFHKLDEFASQNGLKRSKNHHREIYLNNANRTDASKLKTILRYEVIPCTM